MSSIDDSKTEAQKAQELRNERARQEAEQRRLERQATRSGDTGDRARQQLREQNETDAIGKILERIMPQIRNEITAELAKATQLSQDNIAEKVLSRIQLNSGAGIACSGAGGSWTVALASDNKPRPTTVTATCNDDGTITITAS